jgi:hypothetical protein
MYAIAFTLAAVERLLELVAKLGSTAAFLSQAEHLADKITKPVTEVATLEFGGDDKNV